MRARLAAGVALVALLCSATTLTVAGASTLEVHGGIAEQHTNRFECGTACDQPSSRTVTTDPAPAPAPEDAPEDAPETAPETRTQEPDEERQESSDRSPEPIPDPRPDPSPQQEQTPAPPPPSPQAAPQPDADPVPEPEGPADDRTEDEPAESTHPEGSGTGS